MRHPSGRLEREPIMNDPPPSDVVRARMQQIRCEIDLDLETMATRAHNVVDWKHYVKTYPWVCLGTAAALGFLIVPKRSRAIHPDVAALAELAKAGHPNAKPATTAARGVVDALLAIVASIAVRKASGLLAQGAARFLGMAADASPQPPPGAEVVSQSACRRA